MKKIYFFIISFLFQYHFKWRNFNVSDSVVNQDAKVKLRIRHNCYTAERH